MSYVLYEGGGYWIRRMGENSVSMYIFMLFRVIISDLIGMLWRWLTYMVIIDSQRTREMDQQIIKAELQQLRVHIQNHYSTGLQLLHTHTTTAHIQGPSAQRLIIQNSPELNRPNNKAPPPSAQPFLRLDTTQMPLPIVTVRHTRCRNSSNP